jgi:hypothetical protein
MHSLPYAVCAVDNHGVTLELHASAHWRQVSLVHRHALNLGFTGTLTSSGLTCDKAVDQRKLSKHTFAVEEASLSIFRLAPSTS